MKGWDLKYFSSNKDWCSSQKPLANVYPIFTNVNEICGLWVLSRSKSILFFFFWTSVLFSELFRAYQFADFCVCLNHNTGSVCHLWIWYAYKSYGSIFFLDTVSLSLISLLPEYQKRLNIPSRETKLQETDSGMGLNWRKNA